MKPRKCAYRLVIEEGYDDVVLLNFASAKNPGGGFVNGAKAQEEDLARCSGLYACQQRQFVYYERNRLHKCMLYLDDVIYSPNVPWFRRNSRELLDEVFLASVITAPASNAGQYLKRNPNGQQDVEATLRRRAGNVLATAVDNGHRTLILGAWGCGVFRNDPALVADAFATWLASDRFSECFDKVVFAVYDKSKGKQTLKAFQDRLLREHA